MALGEGRNKTLILLAAAGMAASRPGKLVWVRDPALADGNVFDKCKIVSEDANQVRGAARRRDGEASQRSLLLQAAAQLLLRALCRSAHHCRRSAWLYFRR